jgi:predicted nucleotidyltransferase
MAEAADNIVRVARALHRLGLMDAVFVGGATVELHLTDTASLAPRVTLDVDVVVDTPTRHRFYMLEERLREAGHQPDARGPIGRWLIDGVPVDLTPTTDGVLGVTNRWYRLLFETATDVELAPGLTVRLATPPMFLATKLEAHLDRGAADPTMSQDLTDIVSLVNGRPSLEAEVGTMNREARDFVRAAVRELLAEPDFAFVVHAHLPPDEASQGRSAYVLAALRRLAEVR